MVYFATSGRRGDITEHDRHYDDCLQYNGCYRSVSYESVDVVVLILVYPRTGIGHSPQHCNVSCCMCSVGDANVWDV